MTVHRLEPAPHTTNAAFSRDHEPVLRIEPGDHVVVHTLDAGGRLKRQTVPGEQQPKMHPDKRGHCLAGPIAVTGARPGDMLALRLVDLRPGEWGWTRAVDAPTGDMAWLLWELDADAGIGTESRGFVRALAPFLGVLGVAPAEPGEHSTIPPRPGSGGNIDCRELVAGATLYLPVAVPDALLYLGDGHAAQGDGEVGGTAIECPMTTELVVDLAPDPPLPTVHARTPAGRVTFGFDADLNTATADALDAMVTWLCLLHDVDRLTALALASTSVDLRITQIANETWGVHAMLPDDVLSR